METKQVEINGTVYIISKLKMKVMRHLMADLTSTDEHRLQEAQEKMVAGAVTANGLSGDEFMDELLFADYLQLIPEVIEFNGLGNVPSPQ